ncbi:MAG: SemiSWEET family sugar transporter [Candidatus Woesearchaeota archaeon]
MGHNFGLHHHHIRTKRQNKKVPNKKFIAFYDTFIYFVGIGVPIITSSQVFKIWITQNASGVSIIAWSAYLFNSIAWLIYGIIHKERPIIYTNIICSVINFLVILGAILYR